MKFYLGYATLVFAIVNFAASASARDSVLPAGTLLQCTLNEPNFSSKTADVGDPVLCHLRGTTSFGQQAFPRGSYLVGHLESDKEPGHFIGKGYLKLEFDRIGLPNGDVPLDAKVIATNGYKVEKGGKIDGKGHATRDVVEWMLPPLWPWKVLTLPARGPRPVLKGESVLSLRLMDDIQLPQVSQLEPGFRYFGRPRNNAYRNQAYDPSQSDSRPTLAIRSEVSMSSGKISTSVNIPQASYASLVTRDDTPSAGSIVTASAKPVFILKTGMVLNVGNYQYQEGRITYTLANGGGGVVSTDDIDWSTTTQVNSRHGVHMTLHGGHLTQEASTGL